MSSTKILEGLTIVDMGVGMAAALVAKYLADAGARVLRFEPAGGDPFYGYYPAYEVWRRGAEVIRGDRDTALALADACLVGGEDYPGLLRDYDPVAISRAHPRLVVLDITGNPHGLGADDRPSTELLAQARSGICFEQFSDRPVAMSFQPASYGAALQGLCGLLAALIERETSDLGQVVRTSLFEGNLAWLGMFWGDLERAPPTAFAMPKDPFPLIFRCSDGAYVHVVMGSAGAKYKLYQVLGIEDPTIDPGDPGLPDPARGVRNFYGDIDLLSTHVARFSSEALLKALWAAGLPSEAVLPPGGCWDHPQTAFNDIVERDADGVRHIGNPILARGHEAHPERAAFSGDRPLSGVRVIDFGAYLAGPLSSAILTDLGADVIKVEPMGGEPSRGMMRSYMVSNRGKRGIMLDLKSKAHIQTALALAESADVVTSNFRSGASKRLGIDTASLHARNSDLVVLESPGYGSAGPLAERAAFDLVMQAFCGHEVRAAGDGDPFWNRTFMVDTAGGMLGAVAILSGLLYRARTGNGVGLGVPLYNAGMFLISDLVQRADGEFVGAWPINASRTGYRANEAMYKTADGWLAIAARGERAKVGLLKILDLDGQIDPVLSSWGEAETTLIAERVAGWTLAQLGAALEAEGVWTEVCRRDMAEQVIDNPAFTSRGNVRVTQHREYGRIRELAAQFTLSRSKVGSSRPIHDIDEHTAEVLAELPALPSA